MRGKLDNQSIVIRVKYYDLIQSKSFLPHLVEHLAAKKEVDLSIIILAFESIPPFYLLSPSI